MNPFVPIFVLFGALIVVNNVLGNFELEISAIITVLLFSARFFKWTEYKNTPFLVDTATKDVFWADKSILMDLAYLCGLITLIGTLIATFGILK